MANDLILKVEKDHTISMDCGGIRETYSLKEAPDASSTLVVTEKKNILHKMDLDTVLKNLDNSLDLLNVAYHAVYGFDVQTQIWDLQKTLMDLNDKGINVIDDFARQSSAVIHDLIGFFDWLTKGAEKVAIKKLERFSVIAGTMSRQAEQLAKDYQKMAGDTSETLKNTIDENNRQYAHQDQIQKEMADFQSEQEAADIAQQEIKKRLTRLQTEYEKLSKAELDAEKHQRTMDIMGAVFSFLGSAASVAADVAGKSGSTESSTEDKEKLDTAQKEANAAKDRLESLKKEKEELVKALETADNDEKRESIRSDIRAKDIEITEAEKQVNKKSSALKSISAALHGVSSQIAEQSQKESSVQENRSKRLTEINAELIRLEEEQTKQLANLAKYTNRLKTMVIEKNSVEAAVRSLIVAVSCLKNVVVAVMDIALFWTSMEKCCKALATSDLKDTIQDLQEIDKEERIEFYYTDSVMIPLLTYMVQWAAVKSISTDFINGAENTRFRLNETITKADKAEMSREQHWDLASKTAGNVANNLNRQVAESNKKISTLKG